jgi:hypothetical protein
MEETILRELLWLNHGCNSDHRYGVDGEMQCSACGVNFKKDPANLIKRKLMEKHGECFTTEHGDICISVNEPGKPDKVDDLDKDRIFPPNEE